MKGEWNEYSGKLICSDKWAHENKVPLKIQMRLHARGQLYVRDEDQVNIVDELLQYDLNNKSTLNRYTIRCTLEQLERTYLHDHLFGDSNNESDVCNMILI